MPILSSSITSEAVQADGRSYVSELHVDSDGNQYTFESLLGPEVDRALLLANRAAELNSQLAAKDEITSAVTSTRLPLTPYEFLSRFTMPERIDIRGSADPVVVDIMSMLDHAKDINPNHPDTVSGLGYLVSVGLLTTARAAEIGA